MENRCHNFEKWQNVWALQQLRQRGGVSIWVDDRDRVGLLMTMINDEQGEDVKRAYIFRNRNNKLIADVLREN